MSGLFGHIVGLGLMVVQALLGVGLVIALIKIIFGRQDGCAHLVGVIVVAIIISLWQAGELASTFHDIIHQLTSGSTPASPFGTSP